MWDIWEISYMICPFASEKWDFEKQFFLYVPRPQRNGILREIFVYTSPILYDKDLVREFFYIYSIALVLHRVPLWIRQVYCRYICCILHVI